MEYLRFVKIGIAAKIFHACTNPLRKECAAVMRACRYAPNRNWLRWNGSSALLRWLRLKAIMHTISSFVKECVTSFGQTYFAVVCGSGL